MRKGGTIVCLSRKDRLGLAACRRPFVFMNMAMTADGKIATANRQVASFGSPRDAAHLYELRALAEAVMCGARTAEASGVTLGPGPRRYRVQRQKRGLAEYPLRVIVTGTGSVDEDAAVFHRGFSPVVLLTTARATRRRLARLSMVARHVVVCGVKELDLPAALGWLRKQWGITRLLCEGGGDLNASLFLAGLVDELHLTICPYVTGGQHAPTLAERQGVTALTDAARLQVVSARRVGDELFCVFKAATSKPSGASRMTHSPRQRRFAVRS